MGATFPDIRENIKVAIGKKETPEEIVKTCLDAICLMKMIYGVDIQGITDKRNKQQEVGK